MKGRIEKEFWFGLDKDELKDFEDYLRNQPNSSVDAKPLKMFPSYLKQRFLGAISDLREE